MYARDCLRELACEHVREGLSLIASLTGRDDIQVHRHLRQFVHTHGLDALEAFYRYELTQGHAPRFYQPQTLLSPGRLPGVFHALREQKGIRERAKDFLRAQHGMVYIRSIDIDEVIQKKYVQ